MLQNGCPSSGWGSLSLDLTELADIPDVLRSAGKQRAPAGGRPMGVTDRERGVLLRDKAFMREEFCL